MVEDATTQASVDANLKELKKEAAKTNEEAAAVVREVDG